jgi:hypothetical protein
MIVVGEVGAPAGGVVSGPAARRNCSSRPATDRPAPGPVACLVRIPRPRFLAPGELRAEIVRLAGLRKAAYKPS